VSGFRPQLAALGAVLLALAVVPARGTEAPSAAADPEAFASCLEAIGARARADGISDATVSEVLARVSYQARVIELDRRQPEFTSTFADYYDRRVTDTRVERGRELLATHRELLERVQDETGVPPHYITAFWGLETNFGSYFGRMSVPDSLATLACDERRSGFFTEQLVAALRIIDAGDITLERMEGSWAGAMGHMQFMPTTFLEHAVDGDGDGRRDLWGSLPDAFSSAGNFLGGLGWEPGWRWGREVRLPRDFDYALVGRRQPRALSAWRALGVTDAFGAALPDLDREAAILVPHGHEGPAFVVYDNFDVILRWNRSDYYGIAVGRLADRIAGAGRLARPPESTGLRLSRDIVVALQEALAAAGHDTGGADGIFGRGSRAALRAWQREAGQVPDGFPDAEVFGAFGIELPAADPS
jgi:membrane-bound lytic murein transglycosylase B